jgi:hypothetical protein
MKSCSPELSLGEPRTPDARQKRIVDFWNGLRVCGDPGATTWEVLEPLEQLVTEYLDHDPPDIRWAESLTAQAALLIEGRSDL